MWANRRFSTAWSANWLVDDSPVSRAICARVTPAVRLAPTVIDTAGLEEITDDSLQGRMRRLTERVVDMADVSLFVIDGASA